MWNCKQDALLPGAKKRCLRDVIFGKFHEKSGPGVCSPKTAFLLLPYCRAMASAPKRSHWKKAFAGSMRFVLTTMPPIAVIPS